jgi:NAD(P)H dehydrogenase (quinone)
MSTKFFDPRDVHVPAGPYSHTAVVPPGAELVFIAGQVGMRADGSVPAGFAEQADVAFENLRACLAAHGLGVEAVVKLGVFVLPGQDFGALRSIREKHFGAHRPTSTSVYVPHLASPAFLLEVEAVAVKTPRMTPRGVPRTGPQAKAKAKPKRKPDPKRQSDAERKRTRQLKMGTRLAITGASGRLGRRTAELVLARCAPRDVILATRTPSALADLAARGADVRYADFDEPASLRAAFAGAERLLLISATDLQRRITQHEAALAAAGAAGVRHVIYTSGSKPAPPNPAAVAPSHYATERALAASGLAWTVLRNSLYADYQTAEALRALETGVLVHNRGGGGVAYVARDDCAAAAAAVLLGRGHDGAVYDITGGETYAAVALAGLYAELGGQPVGTREVDDATFVASLVGAGTDDHLRYGAELLASFGRAIREGYLDVRSDAVEELTGRRPRTLREVLEPQVRGAVPARRP